MIDKRQVIYDIERCISHVPDACRDCSNYTGTVGFGCMENLMSDALAILKEQEPRVMTPQDFDGNPMKDQYGNLPCWLESREPLVASNWCRWNEDDFIRPMMRNFRPWTSRPTDAQRQAVKWDD